MRTVLSVIVGLLFVLAFVSYFLLTSIAASVLETDEFVATAKRADLRGVVVDVLHESLEQELATASIDPSFKGIVSAASRQIIEGAMTDEWFYEVLSIAYGGLISLTEEDSSDKLVDLREKKTRLETALLELGDSALRQCSQVAGSSCRDVQKAKTISRSYRRGVRQVIKAMPDQTNLSRLIKRSLPPKLARPEAFRKGLHMIRTIRWGLLGAMMGLMLLLVFIASSSAGRLFVTVGIVLITAAGIYLAAASIAGSVADSHIRDEFARRLESHARSDSVVAVAGTGSERISRAVIDSALSARALPVTFALLGGFAAFAGGIFLVRRKSH